MPTSKEQWKFIKQKTSPNERIVKVDEIRLDSGEISREPKNIVNCLNRLFANLGVFKGLDIACKYPDKLNIPEFTFTTVTRKELYSVIDSLGDNKAAGPGEISIRLIKSCKLAIGVHLQFALNECIAEKIFPTKMKLAYVTPIFEKGDKLDSTNYRPISVTPSFAKIIERLLLNQMMEYIDKHKIINKKQFGFQKKKSATDAILELVKTVSANLDQSKETVAIFLELAKAFNSISLNIFLKKIEMYGFSQEAKELLFSFLANRRQKVRLHGIFSDCEILNHGVPQGTVLGPLIFLLYVNNFSANISTTEIVIQFADDTSIVCCGQKGSLHGKVTEILQKTEDYVEMNKLTLNTNKTELIFFSRDNSDFGSIVYENEVLTTQKSCRYLGIQIDRNLSFEEQLNKTLRKMAHAIRSIYLIRHQVPLNARILLPKSLVLSHLSFSAIFYQNLSAKNLNRLNRQINWGIKVCFLRKKYDKARDLLIQTMTLPAELIIAKMSLIKFRYDIARPENSENFHGYLSLHQNTRTKQFKIRQNDKTSFGMNSIIRQCVQK